MLDELLLCILIQSTIAHIQSMCIVRMLCPWLCGTWCLVQAPVFPPRRRGGHSEVKDGRSEVHIAGQDALPGVQLGLFELLIGTSVMTGSRRLRYWD